MDDFSIDETELTRSLCRDDFYSFVQELWEVIIPEQPVWNWHIKYLCNELQKVAENLFLGKPKLYDLIINISPGSTKSTICSEMFPAWVWTRMASCRFICGSHGHNLALDLSRKTRDIIQSDKYKALFPEVIIRDDQNTKGEFLTVQGGMRFAIGVGGGITGRHAHFILIDDPIDPQGARSDAEMKVANEWMDETLTTRKVDKAVSVTILIMQRLHMDDPTGHLLDKIRDRKDGKVKHICLPAERTKDIKPKELAKYYVKDLMDPVRLNSEVLAEQRVDLGEFGYAGQFLQTPIPIGGGMFKTDRIKVGKQPARMKKIVRFWDKAGTADDGAYTAGVKLGLDYEGCIWFMDVVRGQWESAERERTIKLTAFTDTKKVLIGVEQEPGSGGKESAQSTVKNLLGFTVRVDRPTGDKVLRADPFSVQVNNGNVYVDELVVASTMYRLYKDELKNFPFSKYKDQVDASSGAFNLLAKKKRRLGGMK